MEVIQGAARFVAPQSPHVGFACVAIVVVVRRQPAAVAARGQALRSTQLKMSRRALRLWRGDDDKWPDFMRMSRRTIERAEEEANVFA